MTNNNARGNRGARSAASAAKGSGKPAPAASQQADKRRPELNLSVQIKTGRGDELVRCGALWAHTEGSGFGGFFNDTGNGSQVRVVFFEPKPDEFTGDHAPSFKVFIELPRDDDGKGGERKTDLYYAGLMWDNRSSEGLNGYISTNLLTGQKLRIVAMPPKARDDRRSDGSDDDIPY